MKGLYAFEGPEWERISDEAKSFIRRLMDADPRRRMSACDVHSDPWLLLHTQTKAPQNAVRLHFQTLQRFHKQNKFRQVCAGVLAKQMDESLLHELHSTFDTIDEDGNGIISIDEFK